MEKQTKTDLLVVESLEGNTEAFGELVDMYEKDIAKVVATMLPNRKEMDDLVQESFLRIYKYLSNFQQGKRFDYWAKAITRNVVRNALNKNNYNYRHMKLYREHVSARFLMAEEYGDWEEERSTILEKCKMKLHKQAYEAIEMKYHDNMLISQIAEHIGRTLEATKKLLSRSRISLKECIESNMRASL